LPQFTPIISGLGSWFLFYSAYNASPGSLAIRDVTHFGVRVNDQQWTKSTRVRRNESPEQYKCRAKK